MLASVPALSFFHTPEQEAARLKEQLRKSNLLRIQSYEIKLASQFYKLKSIISNIWRNAIAEYRLANPQLGLVMSNRNARVIDKYQEYLIYCRDFSWKLSV